MCWVINGILVTEACSLYIKLKRKTYVEGGNNLMVTRLIPVATLLTLVGSLVAVP